MASENYQDMGDQTGGETEVFEAEDAVNRTLSGLRGDGCTVQPSQWEPDDDTSNDGVSGSEGMGDDEDDGRASHMGSRWE